MRSRIAYILAVLATTTSFLRAEEARLLRFPTIHGKSIVFSYAGNLYTVASEGGIARRLTNHDGYEIFPHFSPDGKFIAFTGQYDGNTEVYVMPAEGGPPKRLTWTATLGRDDVSDRMGPNNLVLGWTPDGKKILFRSRMRSFNDFLGSLYLVDVAGGLPEELPLPRGGFASFSPDGKKLAYNRVFREFRTWKRYRGGMADDIWIHDFTTKKTESLTKNEAQDIIPMWHKEKIYFLSDRDQNKRMNLFVVDLASNTTKQLTDFVDFDIKFPTLGDEAIIFENGGYLYTLNLTTEKVAKVPVRILEDQSGSRTGMKDVSKNVSEYDLAPDGKKALFVARGDLFVVPNGPGRTQSLTGTSGAHDRSAAYSPDGKTIAFISDASGEDEIWTMPADGSAPASQLTTQGDCYKFDILWAPDGKKIAFNDRKQNLYFIDLATKKTTIVATSPALEIRDFTWSPDSRWIAYSHNEDDSMNKVRLYSLETAKTTEVTDGWYAASSPAFSSDGKYLFFVSSRDFNPLYSQTEWNHAYRDMQRIYFVTLTKDVENPFQPKADEESSTAVPPKKEEPKKEEPKKDAPKKEEPLKIDLDGLKERVLGLPITPANYSRLAWADGRIFYLRFGSGGSPNLCAFDLSAKKETVFGNVNGYTVSTDGKKMLISQQGKYGIIDIPKGPITINESLNLSGLEVTLDRAAEWQQIFHECWRQMRDFFYDPGMHGNDWKAIRKKYEVLLPYVQHRNDLTYIIGEMISELNCGHAYVNSGETPEVKRIPLGLLGAELAIDLQSKFPKITKILKGANWDPNLRSPLTEIGVNVNVGDYILAINGKPTDKVTSPYELLVNTVGKPTTLLVGKTTDVKTARKVVVTPIADESNLYYYNWVQDNIAKVSEATKGKVGYLHVPDMGPAGLNEFIKHFYPQITKKALIIDVRGNGGGNVSPMLIERLRREIAMVRIARNTTPGVEPSGTFYGPMLCLMNEFSASDGDLFPWRFRHYKLGLLVGKRSWGGTVGIRGSLPLLDGGTLMKPEFSRYDIAGKEWIIEGYGVDPDIVIDNDPAKEYAGTDEQLLKAIELLLKDLETKEKKLPPPPPYPKR